MISVSIRHKNVFLYIKPKKTLNNTVLYMGMLVPKALARERRLSYRKPNVWTKLDSTKNLSLSNFHFGAT